MRAIDWRSALAADAAPRTYAQLRALASKDAIRNGLRAGELTRLVPDQYCLAIHSTSWIMRSRAAVEWAGPGAALTGLAALAAYGYAPQPIDLIQVAVPAGGHRRRPPWARVRSLTMPYSTATWAPTTQMTMPDLAMVLGYGQVPPRQRASYLHGAVHQGIVVARHVDDLARVLTRIPAKRELLERLRLIRAGAESFLEERGITTIFAGAEFADLVYQHRIRVHGENFRLDALHLPTLTAFELDGDGTHSAQPDRERDLWRDALLATAGILTLRFARQRVLDHPEWCREVALEVIEARGKRPWLA